MIRNRSSSLRAVNDPRNVDKNARTKREIVRVSYRRSSQYSNIMTAIDDRRCSDSPWNNNSGTRHRADSFSDNVSDRERNYTKSRRHSLVDIRRRKCSSERSSNTISTVGKKLASQKSNMKSKGIELRPNLNDDSETSCISLNVLLRLCSSCWEGLTKLLIRRQYAL